jgi:hypothetical protein
VAMHHAIRLGIVEGIESLVNQQLTGAFGDHPEANDHANDSGTESQGMSPQETSDESQGFTIPCPRLGARVLYRRPGGRLGVADRPLRFLRLSGHSFRIQERRELFGIGFTAAAKTKAANARLAPRDAGEALTVWIT